MYCDSEDELLDSLLWVREACEQAGEIFADRATLVPMEVTTVECADVVHRVSESCDRLLSRSEWFKTRRAALGAAVDSAISAGFPAEPGVVRGTRARGVNRRPRSEAGTS